MMILGVNPKNKGSKEPKEKVVESKMVMNLKDKSLVMGDFHDNSSQE